MTQNKKSVVSVYLQNIFNVLEILSDNSDITMNLCRLCGEEKSPLDFNVELNDRTSSSWSYRELIEHHTRVELKTNKLLPQSICEECRGSIDGFAEFTQKLQAVQETLDVGEEKVDDPKAEECIELKYFELHEDEIPLKKRARRVIFCIA